MATAPPPIAQLLQQVLARGGMGAPPGGAPGGLPLGPSPASPPMPDFGNVVMTLTQMPSPHKEMEALKLAQQIVGVALSGSYQRSPRAAKECSAALLDIKQALETLGGLPMEMPNPPAPGMPSSGIDLGGAGMPFLGV